VKSLNCFGSFTRAGFLIVADKGLKMIELKKKNLELEQKLRENKN